MSLVTNKAVNYMRTGFLQSICKSNICGFFKPRHEFDDDRNFLAGPRCRYEVVDHRRVGTRPIQSLFDRKDIRIGSGGCNEINNRRKRMVWMMQQYISLLQNRKNIFITAQFHRQALSERRIKQIRSMLDVTDGGQPIQIHGAIDEVHVAILQAEMVEQKLL